MPVPAKIRVIIKKMSRAELVDAAYNAQPLVNLPPLQSEQVTELREQSLSQQHVQLVDAAIKLLTKLTRSKRERGGGDCFFSAFSMATDMLTGRHYTVAELRQLLSDIINDDLIDGWESYRNIEVNDYLNLAYYAMNAEQKKVATERRKQLLQKQKEAPLTKADVKNMSADEQLAFKIENMTKDEFLAYVRTNKHWANEETIWIFSSFFNIQFVVLKPLNDDDWEFIPGKRGSNVDAFIFLYFDANGRHYDLLISNVPKPPKFRRRLEVLTPEETTVFTKDTLSTASYTYVQNSLNAIAVTSPLISKMPVL